MEGDQVQIFKRFAAVLWCAITVVLVGCGGSGQSDTADQSSDQPVDQPTDQSISVLLEADKTKNTYDLIREKGYEIEVPDGDHTPSEEHITQTFDSTLNKDVFEFTLHLTPDNDKNKENDRQRNEIKTWDKSPANMIAVAGETHIYRWKFMLPVDFQASEAFSHIHQLKPVAKNAGGDEIPVITLTARKKTTSKETTNKLELIYRAPANSDNDYLERVDLQDFLGEWVSVEETVTYSKPSKYYIKIVRISDKKTLLEYSDRSSEPLILFRDDTEFVRPKYGLYRQIKNGLTDIPGLKDEILRFADFQLIEKE